MSGKISRLPLKEAIFIQVSVIFVNEHENCQKQKYNEFVNKFKKRKNDF